jgi:hypothetical protein
LARAALVVVVLLVCAFAFLKSQPEPCPDQVLFQDAVVALERCMGSLYDDIEVHNILVKWHLVKPPNEDNGYWGEVRDVDLLPSPGKERLVIFYPDLNSAFYDPEGRLVVFQQQAEGWKAVYDAASIVFDEPHKDWTNWSYHIASVAERADGLEEVLIDIIYSNAMHVGFGYTVLLTGAAPNEEPVLKAVVLGDNEGMLSRYK